MKAEDVSYLRSIVGIDIVDTIKVQCPMCDTWMEIERTKVYEECEGCPAFYYEERWWVDWYEK
jgi:hypothetical protein